MIVLAAETSTLLGSFCIQKDGRTVSRRELMRQGSHSEALNSLIQEMLDESKIALKDVDLFVSGIGPGSFTGIRISLNSIKTYGYFYNKKVLGIDSLYNLALCNQSQVQNDDIILPLINAYKNMVYVAAYKKTAQGLVCLKNPQVVRVQNLSDFAERQSYFVGDGFLQYKSYFTPELSEKALRPANPNDYPTAESAAQAAIEPHRTPQLWAELLPLYLRESEAEENAKGIKYEPLK